MCPYQPRPAQKCLTRCAALPGRRTKAPDALQKPPNNKTVPQRMVAEKILSADATTATIALAFSIINIRQVATVSFFH